MSCLWMEPFDQYPNTASMLEGPWAQADQLIGGIGFNPSSSRPCTGSQSLQFIPSGAQNLDLWARRVFGAPKTEVGVGYHFWCKNLPRIENNSDNGLNAQHLFIFLDATGACQVVVTLGTDGSLVVYRGFDWRNTGSEANTLVLLGRSNPCVAAGSWNHLECKVVIDPAAGAVEVRVNGVTVFNVAGVNTQWSTNTETSQIVLCGGSNEAGCEELDFDDLYAWDTAGESPADFVGNCSVQYRAPVADTAIDGWTPTSGPPVYPLLCDSNDATYIDAPTTGLSSGFKFAALTAPVNAVIAQQLNWRGQKTDSGDCDVTPSFDSGSASSSGAAQPQTTQFQWFWWVEAVDPETSAPWSVTSANNSIGVFDRTT